MLLDDEKKTWKNVKEKKKNIDMEMGCVSEGGSQRFKTELNLT